MLFWPVMSGTGRNPLRPDVLPWRGRDLADDGRDVIGGRLLAQHLVAGEAEVPDGAVVAVAVGDDVCGAHGHMMRHPHPNVKGSVRKTFFDGFRTDPLTTVRGCLTLCV